MTIEEAWKRLDERLGTDLLLVLHDLDDRLTAEIAERRTADGGIVGAVGAADLRLRAHEEHNWASFASATRCQVDTDARLKEQDEAIGNLGRILAESNDEISALAERVTKLELLPDYDDRLTALEARVGLDPTYSTSTSWRPKASPEPTREEQARELLQQCRRYAHDMMRKIDRWLAGGEGGAK